MNATFTGPVAAEIERRLREALAPSHLAVINDSAKHRGHAGDDGSGESHFTVEIEAAAFAGMTRLERQRAVNAALGELLRGAHPRAGDSCERPTRQVRRGRVRQAKK
jgi:BolA family transcriptional regulator, general stress-responsive regulator